jgi:hypothetical protein
MPRRCGREYLHASAGGRPGGVVRRRNGEDGIGTIHGGLCVEEGRERRRQRAVAGGDSRVFFLGAIERRISRLGRGRSGWETRTHPERPRGSILRDRRRTRRGAEPSSCSRRLGGGVGAPARWGVSLGRRENNNASTRRPRSRLQGLPATARGPRRRSFGPSETIRARGRGRKGSNTRVARRRECARTILEAKRLLEDTQNEARAILSIIQFINGGVRGKCTAWMRVTFLASRSLNSRNEGSDGQNRQQKVIRTACRVRRSCSRGGGGE